MISLKVIVRLVSPVLVAILMIVSPLAAATQNATLTGQVVVADTNAPLTGARIHVADSGTGASFVSEPTSADGSFAVGDLPGASYEVGIEIDSRLYIVSTPVTLAPGKTRSVQLAVNTTSKLAPAQSGIWESPLYSGLVVAGSAIVLGILLDGAFDDDKPVVSPVDD